MLNARELLGFARKNDCCVGDSVNWPNADIGLYRTCAPPMRIGENDVFFD